MPIFRRDDKNILFVHAPKTGGTSVERAFADSNYKTLYRDPRVGPASANQLRRCSPQHMHASTLQQLLRVDRFDVVFMLVRDPVARFRSEYAMQNSQDLSTDAHAVDRWADEAFRAYAQDSFVFDNHLRPQSEFYLPGCLVYRLEEGMAGVLTDLNDRFDLGLDPDVPRVMDRKDATGISSSDVVLSPHLDRRVREIYADDFSRFGY